MELTDIRKQAVQDSWTLVKANLSQNAVDFFIYFFKNNPGYQSMFSDLADLSLEELAGHKKLRGHGVRVFYAITSLVDNLDDLDVVVMITKKTTTDHFPRGVRYQHFDNLFTAVLGFLELKLGSAFGQVTKEGWQAVAGALLGIIKEELAALEG